MPAHRRLIATHLLLCGSLCPQLAMSAPAETVGCHVTYGGASRLVEARPVASPYSVPVTEIGSYFLFRIVFQNEPAELAAIKVYVLAARDNGPTPIHQATHPYPPPAAKHSLYGFTGLNHVYESLRDGELQYWCGLSPAAGAEES